MCQYMLLHHCQLCLFSMQGWATGVVTANAKLAINLERMPAGLCGSVEEAHSECQHHPVQHDSPCQETAMMSNLSDLEQARSFMICSIIIAPQLNCQHYDNVVQQPDSEASKAISRPRRAFIHNALCPVNTFIL